MSCTKRTLLGVVLPLPFLLTSCEAFETLDLPKLPWMDKLPEPPEHAVPVPLELTVVIDEGSFSSAFEADTLEACRKLAQGSILGGSQARGRFYPQLSADCAEEENSPDARMSVYLAPLKVSDAGTSYGKEGGRDVVRTSKKLACMIQVEIRDRNGAVRNQLISNETGQGSSTISTSTGLGEDRVEFFGELQFDDLTKAVGDAMVDALCESIQKIDDHFFPAPAPEALAVAELR